MPPTEARYMPRSPADLPLHITQVTGLGQAPLNVTTLHTRKRIGKRKNYLSHAMENGKFTWYLVRPAEKVFGMHNSVYAGYFVYVYNRL